MKLTLQLQRRPNGARRSLAAAALGLCTVIGACGVLGANLAAQPEAEAERYALLCAKLLTCDDDLPVINDAVVLIEAGKIRAIGAQGVLEIPGSFEVVDLGERWLIPGMVDLHSHIAGSMDINGAVFQSNTGLRVRASVVPEVATLKVALAAGVTTILYIPGSATNFGGQGILLKTAGEHYDDMVVRDPGSLKLAQADNPKSWGWRMQRGAMNFQIRDTLLRGVGYARAWLAFEEGNGEEPDREPHYDIFRELLAGRAQISAHTQQAQVVASTIRLAKIIAGLPVFIDHGTMDAFRVAHYAEEHEVPAILGPRSISSQNKGRGYGHDGKILGVAAEYQRRGHTRIGFNTDAPVIPAEELQLQAAMAVRYGFDDSAMDAVRGLTIVPAETAGIEDRVGSIEVGKDADLVAISGHPADPRKGVDYVWVNGHLVYDALEGRRW
ncbi:MAG: imidazolonepropionase-like amidohydrolase [Planctomycetota bacterium]|jgi:imidazolonepropionase-like amidohydrolase